MASVTVPDGGLADSQILYLSTLAFSDEWLDELQAVSDRLVVLQQPCRAAAEVPDDVWREVTVLHTSSVLPHPVQAPKLSWVQLDAAGVDHITGEPLWQQAAVPVTTIGGVSARTIAEYAVLMLLAFSHRLPDMIELRARRQWPSLAERWQLFKPRALTGSEVAIVGYGNIGQAAGALCAALGMHVTGIRRRETAATVFPGGSVTAAGPEALREVLSISDAVIVTLPLTHETRGMLSRDVLQAVKPGAVLVNVGRGGVVDETAVADMLACGRLAGAAFDVFEQEPLPPDSALWKAPNLIISPHVAGFAPDYHSQVGALVSENMRRFLTGRPLLNQADRDMGY